MTKTKPDWYWLSGLHDAQITGIVSGDLKYSGNEKHCRRNFVKMTINSHNALYDDTIKEIIFYNAKILSNTNMFAELWWYYDELICSDGKWILDITLKNHNATEHFVVRFTDVEVKRNK